MRQLLHLLIVDRVRHRAIVQTLDGRWLLPTIACGERVRAPLAVARWLRDRGLRGFVFGQWAGRIDTAGSTIDWLVMVSLDAESPPPFPCSWFRVDRLHPSQALFEYDGWAIERVISNGEIAVRGPFGTPSWIDHVSTWVSRAAGSRCEPLACFRASSHEVVVAYSWRTSTLFFKGVAADCAIQAIAETEAARVVSAPFPATIALERRGDGSIWRLTARCTGNALVRSLNEITTMRAAADVARLQRDLQHDNGLRTALPATDLNRARMTMASLMARYGAGDVPADIDVAFEDVASIETGWTPLDPDPANIFISDRSLQYFDLDAHLAALPLALGVLSQRLTRYTARGDGRLREKVREAYADAWHTGVPWPAVETIAEIVDLTMGWERIQRNAARGEVSGSLHVIERRIASRLSEVLGTRQISRSGR